MHVHLRQHLHALQQNTLSALALYILLVWVSEGMDVGIVELMSIFDRFARLRYWCQRNINAAKTPDCALHA